MAKQPFSLGGLALLLRMGTAIAGGPFGRQVTEQSRGVNSPMRPRIPEQNVFLHQQIIIQKCANKSEEHVRIKHDKTTQTGVLFTFLNLGLNQNA